MSIVWTYKKDRKNALIVANKMHINLWKRRTMNPPTHVSLHVTFATNPIKAPTKFPEYLRQQDFKK